MTPTIRRAARIAHGDFTSNTGWSSMCRRLAARLSSGAALEPSRRHLIASLTVRARVFQLFVVVIAVHAGLSDAAWAQGSAGSIVFMGPRPTLDKRFNSTNQRRMGEALK